MLTTKTYLKVFFLIVGLISTISMAYSYYFSKHYPIPITNRISFDAKIQFIREHINTDEIDTIVVGSSLALNNVQGIYLEKASSKCKKVLNLAIFSASPVQVEQLLELSDVFPNLERIVYSSQFSDFGHASKFKDYHPEFIKKYITNELNPIEYTSSILNACKDVSFCINRQKVWKNEYGQNNKFGYLGFDDTGSAPLNIYGADIIKKRWTKLDGDIQNPEAHAALFRMSKKAYEEDIKFYFVQQPYRQEMIKKYKHLQGIMKSFPQRVMKVMKEHKGYFLNLHETLNLGNEYFADRSHLNDKGSAATAKAIAKFIDTVEQ